MLFTFTFMGCVLFVVYTGAYRRIAGNWSYQHQQPDGGPEHSPSHVLPRELRTRGQGPEHCDRGLCARLDTLYRTI